MRRPHCARSARGAPPANVLKAKEPPAHTKLQTRYGMVEGQFEKLAKARGREQLLRPVEVSAVGEVPVDDRAVEAGLLGDLLDVHVRADGRGLGHAPGVDAFGADVIFKRLDHGLWNRRAADDYPLQLRQLPKQLRGCYRQLHWLNLMIQPIQLCQT